MNEKKNEKTNFWHSLLNLLFYVQIFMLVLFTTTLIFFHEEVYFNLTIGNVVMMIFTKLIINDVRDKKSLLIENN